MLTDVAMSYSDKPCKLREPGREHLFIQCSGTTAYGDACRRHACGRLDGSPVCPAHFTPVKPRKRPPPQSDAVAKAKKRSRQLSLVVELAECVEAECPVCLGDFIATSSAMCGHGACLTCLRQMRAAKSACTLKCPLCRDERFKDLIALACL